MATERQSLDTLQELTNLIGTVSEIQDDPASPDGDWLDAASDTPAFNVDSVSTVTSIRAEKNK